jgi:hypothetical protein
MSKPKGKKKFQPKRSKRFQDVDILEKRISAETPPPHIYYYK